MVSAQSLARREVVARRYLWLLGVILLQIIAIFLYPPQLLLKEITVAVLPATLFILLILALLGLNTGVLTPIAGRNLLVFVNGLNIVMRLMMLLPGARPKGSPGWNISFIVLSLAAVALSWASIIIMERRPPRHLLIRMG